MRYALVLVLCCGVLGCDSKESGTDGGIANNGTASSGVYFPISTSGGTTSVGGQSTSHGASGLASTSSVVGSTSTTATSVLPSSSTPTSTSGTSESATSASPSSGADTSSTATSSPASFGPVPSSSATSGTTSSSDSSCWSLPAINRVRVMPAPHSAQKMVGGRILGSNTSPMNDFTELFTITSQPAGGRFTEYAFNNTTPYRYVKYQGPADSYGIIAEIEFYVGNTRITGAGFGSSGSRNNSGNTFGKALDKDESTYFEAPQANDIYVGIDVASEHQVAMPTFTPGPGRYNTPQQVSITTTTVGATILYTVNGNNPAENGTPYTSPVAVENGSVVFKAVATKACMFPSEQGQAMLTIGQPPPNTYASMHIGNSLTDTIDGWLEPVATAGGITLAFDRYTIPGAGTWLYQENPSGGFGVPNVQTALKTNWYDHLSMQPFPNMPCQPVPSSDGDDSDFSFINMAWRDARLVNPDIQVWVYQQWPAHDDYSNCITGGGWTRGDWDPPAPTSWDDGVSNELTYDETVRTALEQANPDSPKPYIIPGGLALRELRTRMAANQAGGLQDFIAEIFDDGVHLTAKGRYLIALVFYTCMFQRSPVGLAYENTGLTADQAAIFQDIALKTAQGYTLSGWDR